MDLARVLRSSPCRETPYCWASACGAAEVPISVGALPWFWRYPLPAFARRHQNKPQTPPAERVYADRDRTIASGGITPLWRDVPVAQWPVATSGDASSDTSRALTYPPGPNSELSRHQRVGCLTVGWRSAERTESMQTHHGGSERSRGSRLAIGSCQRGGCAFRRIPPLVSSRVRSAAFASGGTTGDIAARH